MSLDRSPPPLVIELGSPGARRLMLAAHGIAAALLCAQPLPLGWRGALLLLCATSVYHSLRTLALQSRSGPLRIDGQALWGRRDADRDAAAVRLTGGQRLAGLLWMQWSACGLRTDALLAATQGADRRLRVRLTLDQDPGDAPSR